MTITPEKLREVASDTASCDREERDVFRMRRQLDAATDALMAAADEIERLKKLSAPSIPTSEEYQQAHNEAYQKPSFGLKP